MSRSLELTVNGERVSVRGEDATTLLDVLRNQLDLKGSRFGCGLGLCGACFVQVDGHVVPACDTPLWSVEGKSVVTVEGLSADGLHPVQEALLEEQAAQCAFCLSGVIVQAAALLESQPSPSEEQVAHALDRNLCRCGSHRRIIRAVVEAGRRMR